ncbi:MAG: penicillin acylase family protein, partial [Candidatus Hydrogenedentota bacterium]
HPEVKPRLITKYEPYYLLCYERSMMLPRLLGHAHAPRGRLKPMMEEVRAATGSNAWAISGSRTKSGNAMLFINPHQPWYGTGMFTEAHVRSDEGWNFSGTTFPGGPFPTAGFNEHLGWAYTVNEPDIGDVYRVTFDHPSDPLKYRYDDGWRTAEEWKNSIRVGNEDREYTFRRTHHGPVMGKEDDTHYLAVKVAKLFEGSRMKQALAMTKATNFDEWYKAAGMLHLQMFNTVYADKDNNIFYLYNGTVAQKDPRYDWRNIVDGSTSKTEWGRYHTIEELPQVLNPLSGFVQNCNSTPFTTTDDGNPSKKDYPSYMVEDKDDDKRRSKMSRFLLRGADDITFEVWQDLAYDTTLYWPMTELSRYAEWFEDLQATDEVLAQKVKPYLDHLLDWDNTSTTTSTQTTLCVEWYEGLYGRGYPVETLKNEFVKDIPARFQELVDAAARLEATFGDWKVPYGSVHRLQRHADQQGMYNVPFSDDLPSLPQVGVRGPLGVAFTVYHTPSDANRKNRYAGVGASYMATVEFGEHTQGGSYLHYGQSGDPDSPHFFDQALLLSQKQFKPAYLYWDDVEAHTVQKYHPGEE